MRKVYIAPSILSANFATLADEIKLVENANVEWLHYDVMDGHFVPNISFGPKILGDVRKVTGLFLDVHLMIMNPLKYVHVFAKNGADLITIHYESFSSKQDVIAAINEIKQLNVKVGLSIKPGTKVNEILDIVEQLDLVLIMSVEPGFGGQKFMDNSLEKVKTLREHLDSMKLNCLIEIDGGIDDQTAILCKDAGVDVLVAGSYLFGHHDIAERVEKLRK